MAGKSRHPEMEHPSLVICVLSATPCQDSIGVGFDLARASWGLLSAPVLLVLGVQECVRRFARGENRPFYDLTRRWARVEGAKLIKSPARWRTPVDIARMIELATEYGELTWPCSRPPEVGFVAIDSGKLPPPVQYGLELASRSGLRLHQTTVTERIRGSHAIV